MINDDQPLTDNELIMFANILNAIKGDPALSCMYRNWRGEVSERHFRIREFWHGSTEWHLGRCLLLRAFDIDKQADRDFCVADFDTSTLKIKEPTP
jgi:hypothetical protein